MKVTGKDLWNHEYQIQGIPSSQREEPSGAVVAFLEFLRAEGVSAGAALDIGCGKGRNSLYLAREGFAPVIAMDFAVNALQQLRQRVESQVYLFQH